jgi:hypothetical protein
MDNIKHFSSCAAAHPRNLEGTLAMNTYLYFS